MILQVGANIFMNDEELKIREEMGKAAREAVEKGDATGWFDDLYRDSDGNPDLIPWADMEPNRFLMEWDDGRKLVGKDRKALVVGCGLGDEAKLLADRGFTVTAFDISEKAVEWAKRVQSDPSIEYLVADMFDPPDSWKRSFDLVVEVYTIQALPLELRRESIEAIAGFVADDGELVAVQRLRADHEEDPDGPPWALSKREFEHFEQCGLSIIEFETYQGDEEEEIIRFVSRLKRLSKDS